jgi:hypothetical protein
MILIWREPSSIKQFLFLILNLLLLLLLLLCTRQPTCCSILISIALLFKVPNHQYLLEAKVMCHISCTQLCDVLIWLLFSIEC